ncbi:MAG: hypothetical protein MPK62_00190 [Alphaproteobacteria bacterium]|nr:hypothetical protein [Alphaproteobacteria bacterium]MDA8029556.1 hypothetical protein [Alphaproteobacteria bacterium]
MQEVLGGVVALIAIAITIGIGTSILGQTGSAFDCRTLDGYSGPEAATYSGEGKENSKLTTRGVLSGSNVKYNATFSHGPINAGDTAPVSLTLRTEDGSALVPSFTAVLAIGVAGGDPAESITATTTTGTAVATYTYDEGAARYGVDIDISHVGGVELSNHADVSFNVRAGDLVTAYVPENYQSWAETCRDAQAQTTQAWTLIPIILIVIVAAMIIVVLRGFYGSTG